MRSISVTCAVIAHRVAISGFNPEQCSTRASPGELIPVGIQDDPHFNGKWTSKPLGAGQCCPHNRIVLKNLNFTKNLVFNNLYNFIPRFPGWSLLPDDLANARQLGLAAAGDP